MNRSRKPYRRIVGMLAGAVALAATGCGGVTSGHPVGHYPDPESLDTGAYSVRPLDVPPARAGDGRVVESMRMAEVLLDPAQADPALRHPVGPAVVPLPTPAKAALLLAAPVRDVLERNGMLAGAAVSGSDRKVTAKFPVPGTARLLTAMVLRFPDADAAQRAAREIDAVDFAVSPDNVPVSIPGYPAAHAHWRPAVPTAAATAARGEFVVSLLAGHTAPDPDMLTTLARKAFDAQFARLGDFVPTPPDAMATLPLDHESMVRRLVPDAPGRWTYPVVAVVSNQLNAGWDSMVFGSGVVYGPRAAWLSGARTQTDFPIETMVMTGFNRVARYADPGAARRAYDAGTAADAADSSLRPAPAPERLPDSVCWSDSKADVAGNGKYFCRVLYGRYTAAIITHDLPTAQHKTAAQYGLLAGAE
ncbi:hypothetical protein NONO_c18830 [Nocardia nova SH22a]|uniref:Lipoprotein n=1 Tax=Nocardia nova SH22a TaxID=1415166 RepID=W5TCG8_9NOCA|nr:hypothetical protein [Nocardia nova]AHH16683.1 hypothetical protein NONO_c18830 [Nocardia nova SH22a]